MKPTFLLRLLPLAILVLPGCALMEEHSDFDPEVSFTSTPEEHRLRFMKLPSTRALSSADLRPDDGDYRVGAGDVLQIEIVEVPDTLATTMIMPDGKVYYDVASGVDASGLTIPDLEEALAEELKEEYPFPVININTVKAQSRSYSIMGQVIEPGVYELNKPTAVLDAISMAGGVRSSEVSARTQNLADLGRSVLIRSGKILPVDFRQLVEQGDMSQNVYLRDGDYLYLPAKGTDKVYVLGNVLNPRAVGYASDLTLVKALAATGGPQPSSYLNGVLIVRGATDAEPQVATTNVHAIMTGAARDFHLEPGDVIWVPRAPWKKLGEYAQVAVDSAVSTIAIQEAANWVDNGGDGGGSDVELGISTGPARDW